MPTYAWVCFACQRRNAAGTERCEHCGFSARATTREIGVAREQFARSQDRAAPPTKPGEGQPATRLSSATKDPSSLVAVLMVGFGVVCLFGAYKSLTNGHWPAFMPPHLDLLAVPLGWLSERLGAYVGGVLSILLGVVCVVVGLASAKHRNAA